MMTPIEQPNFDEAKIVKFHNLKPEALKAILNHLVFYYNDNLEAYILLENSKPQLTKVIGQGIIFNFYIIERMITSLGINTHTDIEPDIKNLRDCIAHFDERIKLYYNSDKEVQEESLSIPNISRNKDGGISVIGVNISGANLTINSDTGASTIKSPFGCVNNILIGLDRKGRTIKVPIDSRLFTSYKNLVDSIISKYI